MSSKDKEKKCPLELLREEEVAVLLKVSKKTLQHWRVIGKGPPFIRMGGAIRYVLADVLEFIESNRRNNTCN